MIYVCLSVIFRTYYWSYVHFFLQEPIIVSLTARLKFVREEAYPLRTMGHMCFHINHAPLFSVNCLDTDDIRSFWVFLLEDITAYMYISSCLQESIIMHVPILGIESKETIRGRLHSLHYMNSVTCYCLYDRPIVASSVLMYICICSVLL